MQKIVWTLWWQGEEKAPDIVKACIQSMRENFPYAKVIVLNKDNIHKYINIPNHIFLKFKRKLITITHLSDIIRMRLLYKYGGLWMDSTVYVNSKVPERIFDLNFFTIKKRRNDNHKGISKDQWCGFLIGGRQGENIFELQTKLLNKYWEKENYMIDYLLIDYFMDEILKNDDLSKHDYDKCPIYKGNILQMQQELSIKDKQLSAYPLFNKLSWKNINTGTGINTVYFKILRKQRISFNFSYVNPNKTNFFIKIRKLKSGLSHTIAFLNFLNCKEFGFDIHFYKYINSILRTNHSSFAMSCQNKYDSLVLSYLDIYMNEVLSQSHV